MNTQQPAGTTAVRVAQQRARPQPGHRGGKHLHARKIQASNNPLKREETLKKGAKEAEKQGNEIDDDVKGRDEK
ncbi:MAG: hypothetical protein LC790_19950, partial [Actinobacteria bacterium]|nr:hypothetical protein [Actinomycetota bacterium]MCA1701043.1 hypothetical protein [Actinomycetota bacterium]